MSAAPYTVITADSHAGASVEAYREYLDAKHKTLFDDWRAGYKNPQRKHIGSKKHKNWADAERMGDMEAEGIAGEILFPNTVPPFFRTSVLICGNPSVKDFPLWLEGIRAHNRWLVDFCAEAPERRAGIGLVYLNDLDEAIRDVQWIAEHGLRGGILLPHVPPDCTHIAPLYAPEMDRFWAVCQDTGVVLNQHGGTGSPDYGRHAISLPIRLLETGFYSTRSVPHLLMSGVFERFP
jgi:predicted TIM-barrel fold metal-dependent hydrolase